MSDRPLAISHLEGRGLPLRGDDIDTDRIMPARFLQAVSFEGLERISSRTIGWPIRRIRSTTRRSPARRCWSSTPTSAADPRASTRRRGCCAAGIRAIIGESFSEIFLGNSAMLGLPCFVARHDAIDRLQTLIEQTPQTAIELDVDTGVVTAGALRVEGALAPALRDGFLSRPVESDGDAAGSVRGGRAVAVACPTSGCLVHPAGSSRASPCDRVFLRDAEERVRRVRAVRLPAHQR